MDELTLLRRLDAEPPAPSATALSDAFEALSTRMAAAEQAGHRHVPLRRRPRTPRPRRVAVLIGAAAVLAAALVAGNVMGFGGIRTGASAQAAELLERAAARTIRTADPVVRPGQFLRVRTDYREMSEAGTQERPLRWLRAGTDTTWIPFDRSGEWTLTRTPQRPVDFFSAAAKTEALRNWAVAERQYGGRDELLRGRAGDFYGTPADEVGLAGLPRDPRALLDRIHGLTRGQGRSADGEALEWIASQLRTGIVPADLRASLYRAAALIPGVRTIDDEAVLDGRTGVAIGRVEPGTGIRQEIVLDPDTGLLVGERQVTTHVVDGIPAGRTIESTAVTTRVVDSAPSGPDHRVQ